MFSNSISSLRSNVVHECVPLVIEVNPSGSYLGVIRDAARQFSPKEREKSFNDGFKAELSFR